MRPGSPPSASPGAGARAPPPPLSPRKPAPPRGRRAVEPLAGGGGGGASRSDHRGRKPTYVAFFALGILLYAAVPLTGRAGSVPLFVACFAVILSMYGGGFATIPAYLADVFGATYVGAIHGRLLTAWSTAGILGPALVNYIREFQIGRGVAPADAYN